MKQVIVLLLLALASSNASLDGNRAGKSELGVSQPIVVQSSEPKASRSLVANAIQAALEGFRDTVVNGNNNIPPLDPLDIPHIGPFSYRATGVRVNANVYNFNFQGLRWFVVEHVNFDTLRLRLGVKITVPWLIATGSYDAAASITLLSHNAGGDFRVFVNRLETSVDVRVGASILTGSLFLRELDISIVIHDVAINITGMTGSSLLNSLINSFVQNAAQNLLRDEMETLSQTLSRELFDTINEFLANFSLDDLSR